MSKRIKEWTKHVNDITRQKQNGWFYHVISSDFVRYYLYYKGEHILLIDHTLEISIAL
jgi:hypothetical protein